MTENIYRPLEGSWSHHDYIRHWMYEDIFGILKDIAVVAKLDLLERVPEHFDVLEFGAREPTTSIMRMLVSLFGMGRLSLNVTDYPKDDLENLSGRADNSFNITIADQVLEHVHRPWVAAEELWRITKPGGLCIVTTPFMYPLHFCPTDCWRISPQGYETIFPAEKWHSYRLNWWGNMEVLNWEYRENQGFKGRWMRVAEAMQTFQTYNDPVYGSDQAIVIWWIGRKK